MGLSGDAYLKKMRQNASYSCMDSEDQEDFFDKCVNFCVSISLKCVSISLKCVNCAKMKYIDILFQN